MTETRGLVRIAVDAMGGDHAPVEIVSGAIEAARGGGVLVMLVGDSDVVKAELSKYDVDELPIVLIPSEGVITEDDSPAMALRQKPQASILIATWAVKNGKADAIVTMGSTGAAMAAAVVALGVIEGLERPAIGGPIVGLAPRTIIIDVGANVDCRPAQLVSFAVIGNVYARQLWGVERPRVALLSVGAESGKGNRQVRETMELLKKTGLNFVGNVEANDLTTGMVEVVVCDGFTGNVVMKLIEGLGSAMADFLRERLDGRLSKADIHKLTSEVYDVNNVVERHGGGPLLGVNGVSVLGHGRGNSESVRRAITTARRTVEVGFVPSLNDELARVRDRMDV